MSTVFLFCFFFFFLTGRPRVNICFAFSFHLMKFMNHAVGNTCRQKYKNQPGPKIISKLKKNLLHSPLVVFTPELCMDEYKMLFWCSISEHMRRLQTLVFCQCDIAAANGALTLVYTSTNFQCYLSSLSSGRTSFKVF